VVYMYEIGASVHGEEVKHLVVNVYTYVFSFGFFSFLSFSVSVSVSVPKKERFFEKSLRTDHSTRNGIAKFVSGSGKTPLHWMAMTAPLDVIKYFLEMYPEAKNIKCNNGDTPLHVQQKFILFFFVPSS